MKKFALMLGLLSLVGLSACGTNDSNVGGDVGGDGNKPTGDPVVNVYMPSPAGLQKSIEKGFEDANPGIDMVVTSGTTGELLAKIESEKANPVCDVLILASWSDGMSALSNPDLSLYAYEPENSDKIAASFKEDSHKIYGTSASAVGVIYNTDNVKLDDLKGKDWGDFASWDSKTHPMAIPDPTLSGAAKDFVAGIVSHFGEEEGWKIMNGWASDGLANGGKNGPAMTSVVSGENDLIIGGVDYNVYEEKKIEETQVVFLMDRFGYARTVDTAVYERNKETADAENKYVFTCMNTDKICVFTDSGKMHTVKVLDLPYGKFRDKGTPVDNVSNYDSKTEQIVLAAPLAQIKEGHLCFVTGKGMVKQVEGSEFEVSKRTIAATKLGEQDTVVMVQPSDGMEHLVLQTRDGYFLKFSVDEIPEKKKGAIGVRGMKLGEKDCIENVYYVGNTEESFIEYKGKKILLNQLKVGKRDSKGTKLRI